MPTCSENLWLRIRPVFERLAARVVGENPGLMHSIANITNNAFFLRAYLAFRKHNDGNDIAIFIEAILADHQLTITTDVCWGDGEVLAVGPSSTFLLSDLGPNMPTAFNEWLAEFEMFLQNEEISILKVASELS